MLRACTAQDEALAVALGITMDCRDGLRLALCEGQPYGVVGWDDQPFESRHLGRACARVTAFSTSAEGDLPKLAEELAAALRGAGYAFATCRVAADDQAKITALTAAGATQVETLVTYQRPLPDDTRSLAADIDLAGPEDAEDVAALGRRVFMRDRFHRDPCLPTPGADALKADWMRNAVLGRADCVFVARQQGELIGANACLRHKDHALIDLIGVLPEAQGQGLGRRLVEAALAHYAKAAKWMAVGTQADNRPSTALYERLGFRPIKRQATFHFHFGLPS